MGRRNKTALFKQLKQTQILRMSHEGRGIADIEGKTTFIRGALPEEQVEFRYLRAHRQYDEGVMTDVLQASPQRVTPACEYFLTCGGCSLQHLDHAQQVQFKQQVMLEQLQHIAGVVPTQLLDPIVNTAWHYRNKARLGVKFVAKKPLPALVGFREVNGRVLTDMQHCAILETSVDKLILPLRQMLVALEAKQSIPQIEVAVADKVALIFRHLEPLSENDLASLASFAKSHNVSIYLQPKGLDTIHLFYPTATDDLLSYALADQNLTLQFHPSDFTQINPAINQQMINQALSLLDLQAQDQVLDLFCGLGNFTLPIAQQCQQVTGVEGEQRLIARAQSNTQLNDIENADFSTADLFQPLNKQTPWLKNFDKILLDPPRAGAKEIISQIELLGASHIVYVSCNPATFARDAGVLVNEKGFALQACGILDMFPHTAHVETMGLFCRH